MICVQRPGLLTSVSELGVELVPGMEQVLVEARKDKRLEPVAECALVLKAVKRRCTADFRRDVGSKTSRGRSMRS